MSLFKRKPLSHQGPSGPEFTPSNPLPPKEPEVPVVEEQKTELQFRSPEEAGEYSLGLLDQNNAQLQAFYEEAKLRGIDDDTMGEAIVDAIRAGALPAVAERRMPRRDGRRPIYLVATLPEYIQDSLSAFVRDDKVKVTVRDVRQVDQRLLEQDNLLVLNGSEMHYEVGDWNSVVAKYKDEIESKLPPQDN